MARSRVLRHASVVIALTPVVLLAACGPGGGAGPDLPRRMPDVVGETLEDTLEELDEAGFMDILLFTTERHAVDAAGAGVDRQREVVMSYPEPGEDSLPSVGLWVGERPAIPENVPEGAWYYPHGERIAERGTDSCLTCHERDACGACHEERLERTDALVRADPEAVPGLAAAIADALGLPSGDVLAVDAGGGWFRIETVAAGGTSRELAEAARVAAVAAFPAGFETRPDAETLVIAWVDGSGEVLVEIGFERASFRAQDWALVEPGDVPWITDRYAVPSR